MGRLLFSHVSYYIVYFTLTLIQVATPFCA